MLYKPLFHRKCTVAAANNLRVHASSSIGNTSKVLSTKEKDGQGATKTTHNDEHFKYIISIVHFKYKQYS